jgi:hypothetical protein
VAEGDPTSGVDVGEGPVATLRDSFRSWASRLALSPIRVQALAIRLSVAVVPAAPPNGTGGVRGAGGRSTRVPLVQFMCNR